MYPTATRKPGPEKASTFFQKAAPVGMPTVLWTSGREGVVGEPCFGVGCGSSIAEKLSAISRQLSANRLLKADG
jgi:hypothetical protein